MRTISSALLLVASVASPALAQGVSQAPGTIAFTQHGNVWLMDVNGENLRPVTTLGSATISYPKYGWSRDGRYLFVVRRTLLSNGQSKDDLLLLGHNGGFIRILASTQEALSFSPGWAIDANEIAYIARQQPQRGGDFLYTVDSVSTAGTKRYLWRFKVRSGCDYNNPDPSEAVYDQETGFAGLPAIVSWSVRQQMAVYSADWCGRTNFVDLRTGSVRRLVDAESRPADEARLSPDGGWLVAHVGSLSGSGVQRDDIVLGRTTNLNLIRIARGSMPTWSRDGRTVYFTSRQPGAILHMAMKDGLEVSFQTYRSSIWQASVRGTAPRRLLTLDAYGIGPVRTVPGTRGLIFTSVDNDWRLYRHRLPNGSFTDAMIRRYGPRAHILRSDPGQPPIVLADNAGRPAVRP